MTTLTRSSWFIMCAAALMLVNCVEPEVTGPSTGSGGPTGPGDGGGQENLTRSTKLMPDTDYTRNLEIYDNVKILDVNKAYGMEKTDTEIIFPDVSQEGDWIAGDVVVSDVGDGVFRVIERVETRGTQFVLVTRPAKLEDAIANGEIYMAKLAEDNIEPPENFKTSALNTTESGLLVHSQALGFDKDVGWKGTLYEYNEDFKGRLNETITDEHFEVLIANVSAEIGAEVYANVKAQLFPPRVGIDSARVASNGKVVGDFRIRLQSDDAFSYNDNITLVGPSSSAPLQTFEPISHTLLPGLFPLKFTFDVNSQLAVSASADGEVEADMGYKIVAGATAGVEKKDGEWRFIQRNDLVPLQYGPVFRGEKNARAEASITTTLSLTIGEKANGFARLKPADAEARFSQVINADTGECPTELYLHARGTFEGQLESIDIPLLGTQEIMDDAITRTLYDRTLIDYAEQLDLPGICDPGYMPPTHAGDKLPGEKCGGNEECAYADCFKNTCVNPGSNFRVAAAWYEATDGDLAVRAPNGKLVGYAGNGAGGRYNFSTCYRECSTPGPYVENIFFDETAEDGTYQVFLKNYDGVAASNVDIEVKMGDETISFQGQLPGEAGAQTRRP